MALNPLLRRSARRVEEARRWEDERRALAEKVLLAAERAEKARRDVEYEIERQLQREALNKQYAADRELSQCPHCQRFLPFSEIDNHILGCREEATQPQCPRCGRRMPAWRFEYHVAKCGPVDFYDYWAQGS